MNCRINNLIFVAAREGIEISLWFLPADNYKNIEQELSESQAPEWNRI